MKKSFLYFSMVLLSAWLISCGNAENNPAADAGSCPKSKPDSTEKVVMYEFKATPMALSKIPGDIHYTGDALQAIKFTDKSGEHIALISETKHKTNGDYSSKWLFAGCYTKSKNGYTGNWTITDGEGECLFDITAAFIPKTFEVTDLDEDNLAEIWVMYKVTCRSDVSPAELKIIMYEDKQKFAMRGSTVIDFGDGPYGGEYSFDKAFQRGPAEFRDYAQQKWKENSKERYD